MSQTYAPAEVEAFNSMMDKAESDLDQDLSKLSEAQEPATVTEQVETPTTEKPGTPVAAPDSTKTEPTKDQTKPDTKPPEKKPSEYDKAKARQNKQWEKIQAEKEALRKEREELEKSKVAPVQTEPPAQRDKYTAKDYAEAADRWELNAFKLEDAGKYDEAAKNRHLAELARNSATEALKIEQARVSASPPEVQKQQMEVWEKTKAEFPELVKKGSPLNVATEKFVRENPEVLRYAQGPRIAAVFCQAELTAARVPGLNQEVEAKTKEIEQLKTKVKELESLTSLPDGGSPASPPSGPRSFEELTMDEMEASLKAEMAA